MRPNPPLPPCGSSRGKGPGDGGHWGERLLTLTLALEEALAREAWEEADDLFAARDGVLAVIRPHDIPREVDDVDARILARLQRGQAEIRAELLALNQGRQAAHAYGGPAPYRSNLQAA